MIEKEEKKVSIITPCYNGEAYADRFFKNILAQSYRNIELIFVDDGSTDNTYDIAQGYVSEFQSQNRELICIKQEHAGQAEAINQGLAIFSGDYLMWTDSDDILDPENIRKKVEFLEKNPEFGFVMCCGQVVHEANLDKKIGDLLRVKPVGEDTFFRDMILEKNVVFTPGVYMTRREAILKSIPKRHIIPSRLGQNWQMLLPLSYSFKCGYLKETLFSYVIREDSHSRRTHSLDEVLDKVRQHNDLLVDILIDMGLEDSEYMKLLKGKLLRKEFDNGYHYKNRKLMREKYRELKKQGVVSKRDTLILWSGVNPLIDKGYYLYKKSKKFLTSCYARL